MDKMIKEGNLSKDQSHNLFMISLLRSNNIDEAEKLLSNMIESGINPNGLEFNTLIKGMCFMGGFSDALSWHHLMEKMDCALDIDSCSIILHMLCNSGYVNEVAKVLQSMVDKGIMVDTSIFDVVIGYLNKAGKYEEVVNLLRKLKCQVSSF